MGKQRFNYLNPFSAFLMAAIPLAVIKTHDMRMLPFLLPIAYTTFKSKYIFLQLKVNKYLIMMKSWKMNNKLY